MNTYAYNQTETYISHDRRRENDLFDDLSVITDALALGAVYQTKANRPETTPKMQVMCKKWSVLVPMRHLQTHASA